MSISGNSSGMEGTIYAPAAMLTLSGNAQSNGSLIVSRLNLTGNAGSALTADGFTNNTGATGGAILAGDFYVYVDNSNGLLVADELMRIEDAIAPSMTLCRPTAPRLSGRLAWIWRTSR